MNTPKTWTIQLVSPDGTAVDYRTFGHLSSVPAESFPTRAVTRYLLERSDLLSGREIILKDPHRALMDDSFHEWHSFRLSWGDQDPREKFAASPDGRSTDWHLWLIANGKTEKLISGSLPVGWWDMNTDEQSQWQELHDGMTFVGYDGNTYEY